MNFTPEIEHCWQYAQSIPTERQLDGIHGITHWRRVEAFGLQMSESEPDVDVSVIRLFACFHDFQRKNNGRDLQHGPNAASALLPLRTSLLSFLSDHQFAQLIQACREHTARTSPSGDITVDTCIDSDRLDLGRCGIVPDPRRMLTPKGAELARQMAGDKPIPPKGIGQHIEEHVLAHVTDADFATRCINSACHEADLCNLVGIKMFALSSYACLPMPDISSDPDLKFWFTSDQILEMSEIIRLFQANDSSNPYSKILIDVFRKGTTNN